MLRKKKAEADPQTVADDDGVDPRLRPLEERLQQMEWPKPPPGTKERCLEQFMQRIEETQSSVEVDSDR